MYIDKYKMQIQQLCEKHSVKFLFAFGSALTDKFSSESDIDFLVDINANDPIIYAENYFDLKFKLEELLKRPIDLLENKALKNPYLKLKIDNTKILIYGH